MSSCVEFGCRENIREWVVVSSHGKLSSIEVVVKLVYYGPLQRQKL